MFEAPSYGRYGACVCVCQGRTVAMQTDMQGFSLDIISEGGEMPPLFNPKQARELHGSQNREG